MTFSNEEIERALSTLKPLSPGDAIKTKIEQTLAQSEERKPKKIIPLFSIIALASAACVALVLVFTYTNSSTEETASTALVQSNPNTPSTTNTFANFEPVEAE